MVVGTADEANHVGVWGAACRQPPAACRLPPHLQVGPEAPQEGLRLVLLLLLGRHLQWKLTADVQGRHGDDGRDGHRGSSASSYVHRIHYSPKIIAQQRARKPAAKATLRVPSLRHRLA